MKQEYDSLTSEDKDKLKDRSLSLRTLSKAKRVSKITKKIKKWYHYSIITKKTCYIVTFYLNKNYLYIVWSAGCPWLSGFSFAYKGDEMVIVGSQSSEKAITQEILEYLHAAFVVGI